jgi:hypothetical protein
MTTPVTPVPAHWFPSANDGNVKFSQAVAYCWAMADAGVAHVDSWTFGIAYCWAWAEFSAHRGPAHFPALGECFRNYVAVGEVNPA